MCTDGGHAPGSVAEALRMAHAGLDYLNSPAAAGLDATACGPVLTALGELEAKSTAAHAAFLRRFDAADAHDADGYGDLVDGPEAAPHAWSYSCRLPVSRPLSRVIF